MTSFDDCDGDRLRRELLRRLDAYPAEMWPANLVAAVNPSIDLAFGELPPETRGRRLRTVRNLTPG